MKCNGFWELCECEDCCRVAGLYAYLDWLEEFEPDNKAEINKVKNEIEDMGYSI